ncbi:hypothetical protein CNMCM5793_006677 [Aspergillus hiratsukae]|uniref:Uncharacterized protein n=1 Tax=Aspergillus hiratsukae TaxID=1194566 RepID=A0A8H6PHG4_9EURO|nr:hypothetical protein CNMCM5793_006677 [Aspergillus hiratsukae]
MQQHLQSHRPARPARGRPRKTAERITRPQAEDQTLWGKVYCQRFFVTGPQSQFFWVAPLLEPAVDRIDCIRAQVYEQIRQCEQAEERSSQVITTLRDYSEANPWLDKTRWRDYCSGQGPQIARARLSGTREVISTGMIKRRMVTFSADEVYTDSNMGDSKDVTAMLETVLERLQQMERAQTINQEHVARLEARFNRGDSPQETADDCEYEDADNKEPRETVSAIPGVSEFERPRPKLNDVEAFDGTYGAIYSQFRLKLRAKLLVDAAALGNEQDRVLYTYNRLTGSAAARMLPWMEQHVMIDKPRKKILDKMWEQMDHLFLDRNRQEKAVRGLATLRQANRPFSEMMADFNRLLMEAGGHEWTSDVKVSYLDNALNLPPIQPPSERALGKRPRTKATEDQGPLIELDNEDYQDEIPLPDNSDLHGEIVVNAGYPEIITIHALRRGLANRLDKVATESERSQILTPKNPNVFGRSYIDSTSALSSMDAFLGETMRLEHIEYLRGVGKYRAIGYPRHLPAEQQHAITKNEELRELERRLNELQIQENFNESNDQSTAEESNANKVDENAGFAIKLTRKQIQVLKTRLHNSELAKYREEWIRRRVETQAQPDRQRIANMMPMDNDLSYQDMLSVLESLLAYCTKDYNVFYRPGEEPVDGRCPVGKCDLTRLIRPKRSNHVQDCQCRKHCKMLGYEETQLKYCYECFAFYTAKEWEEHCNRHLEHGMSRRCEIITYCYTLVRPGYCPFCLRTESLSPSDGMRSWKRSNELRSHVINDMKMMCGKYLRYHLSDTHGLHKAIWVASGDESDSKGKLGTRADAVSRGKKRSQEWKGDKKRQRLGPGEAGMFRVIQWASPELNVTTCPPVAILPRSRDSPDGSTLVESNHTGLTPVQVAQRCHPVPSSSNHLATPFRQFGETSFSSADGRLGQLSDNGPGSNADGIECSTRSPSLQPDSIADTLNTSDLPTLYTSDELGSSTTTTSPEILPIDPQL